MSDSDLLRGRLALNLRQLVHVQVFIQFEQAELRLNGVKLALKLVSGVCGSLAFEIELLSDDDFNAKLALELCSGSHLVDREGIGVILRALPAI